MHVEESSSRNASAARHPPKSENPEEILASRTGVESVIAAVKERPEVSLVPGGHCSRERDAIHCNSRKLRGMDSTALIFPGHRARSRPLQLPLFSPKEIPLDRVRIFVSRGIAVVPVVRIGMTILLNISIGPRASSRRPGMKCSASLRIQLDARLRRLLDPSIPGTSTSTPLQLPPHLWGSRNTGFFPASSQDIRKAE